MHRASNNEKNLNACNCCFLKLQVESKAWQYKPEPMADNGVRVASKVQICLNGIVGIRFVPFHHGIYLPCKCYILSVGYLIFELW